MLDAEVVGWEGVREWRKKKFGCERLVGRKLGLQLRHNYGMQDVPTTDNSPILLLWLMLVAKSELCTCIGLSSLH